MKKVLVFLTLIVPAIGWAQIESERNEFYLLNNDSKLFPQPGKSWINAYGLFDLNSSAITNDYTNALLYRGYISNEDKDQVSERLKDMNRFGFEFTGGLTYKYQYSDDLTIVAGLYQRSLFCSRFTKDAFELTFRGNSAYAGKTADLENVKIAYLDYQSFSVGFVKNINEKIKAGAGIAVLRGGRFNYLNIDRGSVFTDTDGAYLDFDLDFKLAFTESESFFTSTGLGAGLNLFLMAEQDKGIWTLEARDIGVIKWKGVNTYEGNSIYRYSGADVGDILNFSDSVFVETKADSIAKELGIERQNKGLTYVVPSTFHLSYCYKYSDKLNLVAGVKQIVNAGYRPRVYMKGLYSLSEKFTLIPTIAYGGFGRMDFELGAATTFNTLAISANVFLLEYLALPKKTSGHGFNLSLTKLF